MKKTIFTFLLFLSFLTGGIEIKEFDLLKEKKFTVNAAGPLLLCSDDKNENIYIINSISSSITVFNSKSKIIKNIPTGSRTPPFLKNDSFCLNSAANKFIFTTYKSLNVLNITNLFVKNFPCSFQPESVAYSQKEETIFAASSETKKIVAVNLKKESVKEIPLFSRQEEIKNLNMTPPPPIRKIIVDDTLQKVFFFDGMENDLIVMNLNNLKIIQRLKLDLPLVKRWHKTGYDSKKHQAYFVLETDSRKVILAFRINLESFSIDKIELKGLAEGVGYAFNCQKQEVYISYDNDPYIEVVSFNKPEKKTELIAVAAYGNDALVLDGENNLLYCASWAFGEIDIVDLTSKTMVKRVKNAGILPHMFSMIFHKPDRSVYYLKGATAVNGSFGAALLKFDPQTDQITKIKYGWPLADFIKTENAIIAFNSEDEMAEISTNDSKIIFSNLPVEYPHKAILSPFSERIYLSFGAHQSFWPAVYIWAARNGILTLKPDKTFEERRLARLAPDFCLLDNDRLIALQNNWGEENQFLALFPDCYQEPNLGTNHHQLSEKMINETRQRILLYDKFSQWLLVLKTGETDYEQGTLSIVNAGDLKELKNIRTSRSPIDIAVSRNKIYIASIAENKVDIIEKINFTKNEVLTAREPVKIAIGANDELLILNQGANCLEVISQNKKETFKLPCSGFPDNMELISPETLIITSYQKNRADIIRFNLKTKKFSLLYNYEFNFGQTALNNHLNSFFIFLQFADNRLRLSQIKNFNNDILISDYLSSKIIRIRLN